MAISSTSYKAPILLSIGKEKHFNSSSPKSWMRLMKILFAHLKDSSAQLRIMLVLCAAEDGQKLTQDWIEEQTSLVHSSYTRSRQSLETLGWITVDAYSSITVNYDKIYENEPKEEPTTMYPNPNQTQRSAFTMRKSYCDVYNALRNANPTDAAIFIDAIIDYGLYGVAPAEDSPAWTYGLQVIFERMDEENRPKEVVRKYFEEGSRDVDKM